MIHPARMTARKVHHVGSMTHGLRPADLRQISLMADSTSRSISRYKFNGNIERTGLSYCPQMQPKPRLKVVTRNCGSKCCTAAMPVPRTRKSAPIYCFLFSFAFYIPSMYFVCFLFTIVIDSLRAYRYTDVVRRGSGREELSSRFVTLFSTA